MGEIDLDNQVVSEDEAAAGEKLVPVGEAIRYRKRAQVAEKQMSEQDAELQKLRDDNAKLQGMLSEIEIDQQLVGKLMAAGVSDLEVAVVMAKKRMEGQDELSVDSLVNQLRSEKGYLFDEKDEPVAAGRTSGVKGRTSTGSKVLESTARRAAMSGNRADVQEYLRLRRQFV